jgi:hypothetical protein
LTGPALPCRRAAQNKGVPALVAYLVECAAQGEEEEGGEADEAVAALGGYHDRVREYLQCMAEGSDDEAKARIMAELEEGLPAFKEQVSVREPASERRRSAAICGISQRAGWGVCAMMPWPCRAGQGHLEEQCGTGAWGGGAWGGGAGRRRRPRGGQHRGGGSSGGGGRPDQGGGGGSGSAVAGQEQEIEEEAGGLKVESKVVG